MKNKTVLFSSNSIEWETPDDLFYGLNSLFKFNLDVCANSSNHKLDNYYDKDTNGLLQKWNGRVWCNPPYGKEIYLWVEKAYNEIQLDHCRLIVMLLPSRTDTKWFHNFIYNKHKVFFIKGRLYFNNSENSAPFPSMIVVMRKPK